MKRNSGWAFAIGVVGLALILAASTGCKKKQPAIQTDTVSSTGTATTPGGAFGDGQPGLSASELSSLLFGPSGRLRTVYFDYDRSELREDARMTLQQNAQVLNEVLPQAPGLIVQIAGHCDERGTAEYNLALGERRALSVRDYLVSLGVPANRLITISYGEEMPAVEGSNEAAWAQNRRAEFNEATM